MATKNLGRVGFVPKGEYNPRATYNAFDVVSWQGSTYVVRENGVTNVTPGTDANKYMVLVDNSAKLTKPASNGTAGQLLRTNGDGTTEWVDQGLPTREQTADAVAAWLDEHPEATTTVQDGALTESKLADQLRRKVIKDYVTPEMFGARGDCVTDEYGIYRSGTDDTAALREALQYPNVRLAAKKYYFTGTLSVDGCSLSGSGMDQTYLVTDVARQCAISIDGTVGGVEGLTLECCGVEINGIEMDGGLAVKPGQFARHVRVNRAEGIGLYYKNGWQSEIHDIYTGNCLVGIRFDGADVTAHDLNISGNPSRNDLRQGLYINSGTVKINNVKIDQYGCALDAPYYPLYVLGQRNHLTNVEVQECGTFGALIGGSYQHVSGLLIDKIGGRTVSVAGGHALRIGMDLDHSVIDAVIRNTIGTTDIVSVGNFAHGSSFAPDYYATPAYCRDNVIHVVSETECIFSDIPPGDMFVLDYSLEEWKALGVVQNLAADGSTSDFRLAIKPATFPNIDFTEIKCLAFELRYLSAQALNTFSFYGDNGSIITRRGQLIFNAANLRYTAETAIPSTGFSVQVTAASGNTFKPTWIRLYLYKRDGRKHYRYYV